MSQLIPESFLIQCVGDHDENNRSQMVSSSDEEGEENEMTENDDLKTVDGIPFLGLIDEENILTLPPEGYGEASDNEGSEDWIAIKDEAFPRSDSPLRNPKFHSAGITRMKKKKRKKSYTVNLTNCKYDSVRRVLRRFGFREVDEDEEWNLYWTDFSVSLERVVLMKTWQKINHFPGMSEICRKDSLARNLNRMLKAFPKDYNIFPKTWCLPSDWNELQTYVRKYKSRTYILKPDTGCQGKGIYITRSFKEIRPMENMICQVYLSKPFLIDGYKFDMRVYVLLTSCDPLRIYVFRDGLVRFTTIPYAEPNQRNMHNMYMHLTNYAVQKHSEGFVRDDEEGGTKRRITTLNRWFVEHGHDVKKIWAEVDDVIVKTIFSGYSVLRHNYRTCFPNHVQTSACFEILGFDIMFNHKLKPYVLEVNHSPSFTTDSKLDREIKEAMLWDTLNLTHFGTLNKRKCIEDERKRIRNRLLNKTARKDVKDATEKEQARYLAISDKYERNHMGNYRRIYPTDDSQKYDQFLSPNATFYQETMTYKVRSECARQQREEIRQKHEKEGMLFNRQKPPLPPESPAPKRSYAKPQMQRNPSRTSNSVNLRTIKLLRSAAEPRATEHTWGDHGGPSPIESIEDLKNASIDNVNSEKVNSRMQELWQPLPILPDEEAERLEGLQQRERFMRSIGLIEAIHRLLYNSRGVTSSTLAKDANFGKLIHKKNDPSSTNFLAGHEKKREGESAASVHTFDPSRTLSNGCLNRKPSITRLNHAQNTLRKNDTLMIKATRPDASESRTRTPFAMPECEHQSANHRSRSPFFTVGHKINTIPNNSLKRHMSATRFPSATVGESYGIISSMNGFRPTFYGRPHKPLPGLEVNNSSGFHQMNSYSAPGCTVNSSLGGSTMNNSGYPVRVHDHLSRPWEQPHEVIVRHFPARNTCVGQRFQKGCHSASKCSDLRDVNGYNDPTQEKFKGDVWKQPWQNPTALIKGAPKKGGFVSMIHFLV
ncbi:Tubulin polyglutamylase TTLL13 [Fasciolopsis buskii]|uniref:Tubulin polyglutamylase TTLL13 n=1 Tax=Fasciolopsis buskii TaxID=27845 RepID=A0A8E0VJF0_9TREM|nr:Tubulin polyglutamylase TTLL13 [Fasciolopsis buski]